MSFERERLRKAAAVAFESFDPQKEAAKTSKESSNFASSRVGNHGNMRTNRALKKGRNVMTAEVLGMAR